jgi:hypothetical protein
VADGDLTAVGEARFESGPGCRSTTVTLQPAWARYQALVTPARPAPMTRTSMMPCDECDGEGRQAPCAIQPAIINDERAIRAIIDFHRLFRRNMTCVESRSPNF